MVLIGVFSGIYWNKMGRRKSKIKSKDKGGKRNPSKSTASLLIAFAVGCILCSGIFLLSGSYLSPKEPQQTITINRLLEMSEGELSKVDIGLVNLMCAEGLDGSEKLDIEQSLATLDEWAEFIRKDVQARMPAYYRNQAKYDNSVNLFKVANMILCLKNNFGVDYNPDIMKREVFPDSKDVFIHGCLTGNKRGGCISIPTLCVAVGRRLGYPLKLVCTRKHVFFRWDDGKEVFNMEACMKGCDTRTNDHYKNWPEKVGAEEIKANKLLKPLTPKEELALFLETRGHCLFDTGKSAEAQVMYAHAYNLMPTPLRLLYSHQIFKKEFKTFRK